MNSLIIWLKESDFPLIRWMRIVYRKVYFFLARHNRRKRNIYPIAIPPLKIEPGLDFLLLQLPSRYNPLLPNGIGYIHNILKKSGIRFQILDANIIFYHRYHSIRILDKIDSMVGSDGYVMKEDPWDVANTAEWDKPEVIEYFGPQVEEILQGIAASRPKAIGLSIHESNRKLSIEFIKALRKISPETIIVVGGYDCVYHDIGPRIIPDFDYMVIGEAELTLEPLIKALAKGERPKDMMGVVSRFDSPGREWIVPPLLEDLDSIGFPMYEWTDMSLYRTYDGGFLMPITASRGCHWSRCRFCGECFPFRKRSPEKVVDEIEFMVSKGAKVFHFNESDVNGDPQNLHDICSEIIRRRLRVHLVGQLRIDRRNSLEYFEHLAKAGFAYLRFGVDGWSDNALRLQRKGYNMNMVFQNLRDCHKADIYTTVNMVIGVPGETEDDVDEMIVNIVKCRKYVSRIESFNTLLLFTSSEYGRNPEQYRIRFRGDKDEIYRDNPQCIPSDLWYSEDPYIDKEIRMRRMNKILSGLYNKGIEIGSFASVVVENLKKGKEQGVQRG